MYKLFGCEEGEGNHLFNNFEASIWIFPNVILVHFICLLKMRKDCSPPKRRVLFSFHTGYIKTG